MKLSIVVSVYNTAKYLEQCLDAILNQTMPQSDYEVIIVNDCSTDNSMEIISSCIKGHENVRVIDKKVNEATFWSRVDGLVAAKGDYVGFVDSDDWCDRSMYEIMVRKGLVADADIVECGTIYVNPDGSLWPADDRTEREISPYEMIHTYCYEKTQVALYIRIFSRRLINRFLEEVYPFYSSNREKYIGNTIDDDLLHPIFCSLANKVLFIEESFCHHRLDVQDSNMHKMRNNPKKEVDAWIYRVEACFEVMGFTRNQKDIYKCLEHKQVNIIFALLGKLLETDFYSKEEASMFVKDAIRRFNKVRTILPVKDELRFLHLKLKTWYCFKNIFAK